MQTDELTEHLNALQREECYRVDAVLKESALETTQRVMFVGINGAEQGPYIRKYIKREAYMGEVYERIRQAQRSGRRFRYLPSILDCYALEEDFVVIMEYVHGETLQDAVYRCDPSLAFAVDVFPRLCDAVLELHESFDAPIIHRDLKPTNIMISRDSLTIIDFGIARIYKDGAVDDTRHFGTRAYAPPEQFGFGQTTVRSDVYALGMLLYFCLVEKTPDAHVREIGFFDRRIPDSLRMVLLRATAFDPANRYADVHELRDAFCVAVQLGEAGGRVSNEAVSFEGGYSGSAPAQEGAFASQGGVQDPIELVRRQYGNMRAEFRRIAATLPRWACLAWNVTVFVFALLFLAGCIFAAVDPNAHDAAYPTWFLLLQYVLLMGSNVLLGAFVLFDKREFYARFPRFPRYSFPRQALFATAYFVGSFAAFFLIFQSMI